MPKPLVVVAPEQAREELRHAGVLPEEVFRTFRAEPREDAADGGDAHDEASVLLWPHTLDYEGGIRLAENLAENPADLPAFFGIRTNGDDDEKMSAERAIASLLGSTVVHVVFLDERRSKGGYAEFASFGQIAAWSRAFRTSLRVRFPDEAAFSRAENVLVVIARGQQVKASKEELDAFRECVGEGKTFRSCYFLDYNLHVGETDALFHSALVWDGMLSRLLLAFLLSREAEDPLWMRPGLKVWRSQDCVAATAAASLRRAVDTVIAKAHDRLHDNLDVLEEAFASSALFSSPSSAPSPGQSGIVPLAPEAMPSPAGSWIDFSAPGYAEMANGAGRWTKGFQRAKQSFRAWLGKHVDLDSRAPREVFSKVHDTPSGLIAAQRRLGRILHGRADPESGEAAPDGPETLDQLWTGVAALEAKRAAACARLVREGAELEKARSHFIGRGFGLLVVLAVSLVCGWVLYRLVAALVSVVPSGVSATDAANILKYSLLFAGAAFAGAFAVMLVAVGLHDRAGRKGREAFLETGAEADRAMIDRDAAVRTLVESAIRMRDALRLRGMRVRVLSLLARAGAILETELAPTDALVDDEEPEEEEPEKASAVDPGRVTRSRFRRMSRRTLGPFGSDWNAEIERELDDLVEFWWSGARRPLPPEIVPKEHFLALWRRICREDVENAGHFPARTFVSSIRRFSVSFTNAVRRLVEIRAVDANRELVDGGVRDWAFEAVGTSFDHLASATVPFDRIVGGWQNQVPLQFFLRDGAGTPGGENPFDPAGVEETVRRVNNRTRLVVRSSPLLRLFPQLAVMYQEYRVSFGSSPETGLLRFEKEEDGRVL